MYFVLTVVHAQRYAVVCKIIYQPVSKDPNRPIVVFVAQNEQIPGNLTVEIDWLYVIIIRMNPIITDSIWIRFEVQYDLFVNCSCITHVDVIEYIKQLDKLEYV